MFDKVLILSAGVGAGHIRAAEALERAFLQNSPVVGFYYSEQHFGRASRLVHTYPLARKQSSEAIAALLIARAAPFSGRPALFAASDEFAFLLAQGRDRLAGNFAFHWNSPETSSVVFDKPRMVRLCHQAGICSPRTHVTEIGEDVATTARGFSFPCVVKPLRSFHTAFPPGQKNYVAASTPGLVEFYRRRPDLLGTTFWQEVIEGPDEEIYQCNVLITRSGVVSTICCVRKLRQHPRGYGNMCFGRTEANEIVASKSLALLRLLEYRGFASIEFKRQARENRYYFIEMNPRLPRYCGLFADAGVNLPYLGYLDLVGANDKPDRANHQKEDVYWLALGEDLSSFLADQRFHPRGLMRWILSIAKARSFAWWNMKDPAPFIRSIMRRPRTPAPHVTTTEVSTIGVEPLRREFERQYDNPRQVHVGADTFVIYDIAPPRPRSSIPILFCPGWMENPLNHKETIYALYKQGRRTVFPDAPHGIDTRLPNNLPIAQLRHAAVLIATLQRQGIHEADAIAHSAGAIGLAVAATADEAPCFRNVVLISSAGLCGGELLVGAAFHAWQEGRRETRRQRRTPTERQLIRDPERRRMYLVATLARTIAEVHAIAHVDIRELLVEMRRNGTALAIVHAADDRLFSMERVQRNVDVNLLDGFYSVGGGHQHILLEPSRYARLANEALLALERKRMGAGTLYQDATAQPA